MSKLLLRYMRPGDIAQVLFIDNQSFSPPWSARSYSYEISESSYSHMVVLTDGHEQTPTGWRRWLNGLGNSHSDGTILGYGGLWHIADEGHISTIASHPSHRGNGYGEIVLAAMLHRAITLKSNYVVLEVRVSNDVAQNMYRKYEFEIVGTKQNYYRSDNEDAYDMRLDLNDHAIVARFYERYAALRYETPLIDEYSEMPVRKKQR